MKNTSILIIVCFLMLNLVKAQTTFTTTSGVGSLIINGKAIPIKGYGRAVKENNGDSLCIINSSIIDYWKPTEYDFRFLSFTLSSKKPFAIGSYNSFDQKIDNCFVSIYTNKKERFVGGKNDGNTLSKITVNLTAYSSNCIAGSFSGVVMSYDDFIVNNQTKQFKKMIPIRGTFKVINEE